MSSGEAYFLGAVAIGIGATLFMDLWALFLKRAFNVPPGNYCLVGRWLCYMPEGRFVHASIANAPPKCSECVVGWIAHYVIGIAYALGLIAIVSVSWLARPTVLPALLFGVGTCWCRFSSCILRSGSASAASKAPRSNAGQAEKSLAHASFGLGCTYVRSA